MTEHHYRYRSSEAPDSGHQYILPAVRRALRRKPPPRPIFEIGCGNGANAKVLAKLGYQIIAVDPSPSGVAIAHDGISQFEIGSAYDDLRARFGQFDVVYSLEVVEHLFAPRQFARTIERLLNPDGIAIISTPFHGYFKNLALAVAGRLDRHHSPLWDGGHIKFWNRADLAQLFREVGLEEIEFYRVGRLPAFAKSMVGVYHKPAQAPLRAAER